MGTRFPLDEVRRRAIARCLAGEAPTIVAASLGRSRRWVYKWLARQQAGGDEWAQEVSRRPWRRPRALPGRVAEAVRMVRLELYNEGLFCGAQNIRWHLEELGFTPLPSVRTINRILARHGLTHRRTGRYVPKGKWYPALPALTANAVHQVDYLGPCYLKGAVRFWSLNTADVATGRCATEPVARCTGQATVDALWATWHRLGCPDAVQADNMPAFFGSPTHPRGMGPLIRLCLAQGIEPWFIPPGEPWRNGVVEKFNDHYGAKFLARVTVPSFAALGPASHAFEAKHNSRYRYTKLGGQTPCEALRREGRTLRYPPRERPPQVPLPRPEAGRYHLVRFIRSDLRLDVFGEPFKLPPEVEYEYVVATVEVEPQRLRVTLGADLIVEFPYQLR